MFQRNLAFCKVVFTSSTSFSILKRAMSEKIKNDVNRLRTEAGVTQEELATKVCVSRQTIIALEKGNYTPSVLLAIKIANFFKLPVERVFKISI